MINDDITRSLFVFAKDIHTGKITRVAIPTDVQVGTINSPAELTLLGRFSINVSSYVLGRTNNGTTYLNNSDTIACINYDGYYDGALSVTLPGYPRVGQIHFIKDSTGTANTNMITVYPASSDEFIDQMAAVNISTKYGSVALFWSGERWLSLITGGSSGSGAPIDLTYYTINDESAILTNSRRIIWGSNFSTSDGGSSGYSVDLADTTVVAGSYTNANITVDSQGRLTSASVGSGASSVTSSFLQTFTNGDLVNDRLPVTHSLGSQFNAVFMYDDNNVALFPSEIYADSTNTMTIDLSGYAPITGSWHAMIVAHVSA